ncbi:MAG: asparagine--tRNA ligase, partial [Planctomycetes bacterium]|nr:asparagine--tRNA ligase [Planctomycetota bacterium]
MFNNITYINQLKRNADKQITLAGWLYRGRGSGKVLFLVLRDGSGLCQCIVEKDKIGNELFERLKHLGTESSLTITGMVRADDRSVGGYELAVTDAEIISVAQDYP